MTVQMGKELAISYIRSLQEQGYSNEEIICHLVSEYAGEPCDREKAEFVLRSLVSYGFQVNEIPTYLATVAQLKNQVDQDYYPTALDHALRRISILGGICGAMTFAMVGAFPESVLPIVMFVPVGSIGVAVATQAGRSRGKQKAKTIRNSLRDNQRDMENRANSRKFR